MHSLNLRSRRRRGLPLRLHLLGLRPQMLYQLQHLYQNLHRHLYLLHPQLHLHRHPYLLHQQLHLHRHLYLLHRQLHLHQDLHPLGLSLCRRRPPCLR